MRLAGLMPVRNEDWILKAAIEVALEWVDVLVIGLHECKDNSEAIACCAMEEHPDKVVIVDQHPGPWHEMAHRTALLNIAREWKATHAAIIDADELLTPTLRYHIRPAIEKLRNGQLLRLPGFNLRAGGVEVYRRYHSTGIWGNRRFSLAFPIEPEIEWPGLLLHRREPFRSAGWDPIDDFDLEEGGILHYWGRSERRLVAKHALYKITEALLFPEKDQAEIDRMYTLFADPALSPEYGPWAYELLPAEFFPPAAASIEIDDSVAPWQEAEVTRLVELHGRERFHGLKLFGLA